MTTTAAKTPLRRVSKTAAEIRKHAEDGSDLTLINPTRTTLREGQDVMILSSDGVGFSGYVYGFERTADGDLLTYITLD